MEVSKKKLLDYQKQKENKAKRRKRNRDQKRKDKDEEAQRRVDSQLEELKSALPEPADVGGAQVEYKNWEEEEQMSARHVAEFKAIFEHFQVKEGAKRKEEVKEENKEQHNYYQVKKEKRKEEKPMSKKQRKMMARMKVFDLKMRVRRPDLVEGWDVTSKNPEFLMELKMVRNSVPVPKHWSQKRRYLQYKRGIHKTPFRLPDFIEATGISRVREQSHDKHKSLKQKMKERMQPKMGKIDIDYQVLHDAFFKNQKKPKLTIHGDMYYEGKEYEIRMRGYKSGRLSPELRHALGIPENSPPPWLINMQRYGPPPAYPNLKIPGVNAPIPETISYGYGRLFTDEKGFTVYADCHGLNKAVYQRRQSRRPYWGIMKEVADEEPDYIEDSDDNEDEDEDEEEQEYDGVGRSDFFGHGEEEEEEARDELKSFEDLRSGIESLIQADRQLPEVDIQKKMPPPPPNEPRPLYQVLPEVRAEVKAGEVYSSTHGYVVGTPKEQEMEVNIQKVDKQEKEGKGEKKEDKQKKDKYNYKL